MHSPFTAAELAEADILATLYASPDASMNDEMFGDFSRYTEFDDTEGF